MSSRSRREDEHDAVVCADVLGAFGVSVADVRKQTDAAGSSLEDALVSALDAAGHPTEFLRDVVATADRGIDAPARYWSHAPAAHLADVFDAVDWSFSMRDAHGRPVSADGESPGPYTLSVTDANGITREAPFEYPDTALGDYNLPALVDAINVRLLYGLGCEFVQLSDGTDRWRFALLETDERARLDESYGPRVEVFDRPLLAKYQPGAYVPDDGEDVPLPDWVTSTDTLSLSDRAPDRATGVADLDERVEPDPDAVLDAEGGLVDDEPETADADGTDDLIDFVGEGTDETTPDGPVDVVEDADPNWGGEESGDTETRKTASGAEQETDETDSGDDDTTPFWDEDDWVLDPGGDGDDEDGWGDGLGTSSDREPGDDSADQPDDDVEAQAVAAVERTPDDAATSDEYSDAGGSGTTGSPTDGFELRGGGPAVSRAADDALNDVFDELEEDAATESVGEPADEGRDDDGFDLTDLAGTGANRKEARITDDDFGVDVETSEDDRLAAYGAAIHVGGGISVRGLLDDDDFVPEFPAAERDEVRIEFEEGFDPATPAPSERRETDDGFVWVNENRLSENRL